MTATIRLLSRQTTRDEHPIARHPAFKATST
jgi:hypothetical protein